MFEHSSHPFDRAGDFGVDTGFLGIQGEEKSGYLLKFLQVLRIRVHVSFSLLPPTFLPLPPIGIPASETVLIQGSHSLFATFIQERSLNATPPEGWDSGRLKRCAARSRSEPPGTAERRSDPRSVHLTAERPSDRLEP